MPFKAGELFEFGDFRLEVEERRLSRAGQPVSLAPRVFDLLVFLVRQQGHLVPKEELFEQLWPGMAVEESNLTVNVSALRKVVGAGWIETVSKRGYRFVGEVRHSTAGVTEPGAESVPTAPPDPEPAVRFTASAQAPRRRRRTAMAAAALAALALLAVAYGVTRYNRQPPVRSLAVLPFVVEGEAQGKSAGGLTGHSLGNPAGNSLGNSLGHSLCLSLAEAVSSQLAAAGRLDVRPMSSVLGYSGLNRNTVSAGRELGVDAVVDGTVAVTGTRVKISARLVRVDTGLPLLQQTLEGDYQNIFALEDEVASGVATALGWPAPDRGAPASTPETAPGSTPNIAPGSAPNTAPPSGSPSSSPSGTGSARGSGNGSSGRPGSRRATGIVRGTMNPEAYRLYNEGRFLASRRLNEATVNAIDAFQKAIFLDPKYAEPYAALSQSMLFRAGEGLDATLWGKAKTAALQALNLNTRLAESHMSMGQVLMRAEWDFAGAERAFRRAIELNAQSSGAHAGLSTALTAMGRHDEAVREMQAATALEPSSAVLLSDLAWTFQFARRYDESVMAGKRSTAMDAWSYSACRQLAKTYLSTMQYPEAVEQAKRALDINAGRRRRVMAEYASALAAAGQAEQAKKYLRQITGTGWDEPLPSYELAVLHLRLGDRESALRSLAGAMQRKLTRVIWLRHDPEFDPLRADPRFQQSVRPLGASPLP